MSEVGSAPLLETNSLSKHYVLHHTLVRRARGIAPEVLRAVDDVSFAVYRGETVGLVGESGCGKSTLGRLLLHLEQPTGGEIKYEGAAVASRGGQVSSRFRRKMQIIFQDPYSSLNPRKTVRSTLNEVLSVHNICPASERRDRVASLLERVGLSPDMADRRPHQFSGGQRQRIGIARALAVEPEFIVADEPVSALDVSVQAQVLNLMTRLQDDLGLTYLFISHNLGVVRHISQRVMLMYLGRIVEVSPTPRLFALPLHPYTQALMRAVPSLNPDEKTESPALEGDLPNAINPPAGCPFHTRCPHVMPVCRAEYPALRQVEPDRFVACHLYAEGSPVARQTA